MIDLNLQLPYKKTPYEEIRNHNIYTLAQEGIDEYYYKDHITHKYLSRFHPKIMEYVYKNSKDADENEVISNLIENNLSKEVYPKLSTPPKQFEIKNHQIGKRNKILKENNEVSRQSQWKNIDLPKNNNSSEFYYNKYSMPRVNNFSKDQKSNQNSVSKLSKLNNLPKICYTKNIHTLMNLRDPKLVTAISYRISDTKKKNDIEFLCDSENERFINIIQGNRKRMENPFLPPNSEMKPLNVKYTKNYFNKIKN